MIKELDWTQSIVVFICLLFTFVLGYLFKMLSAVEGRK